MKTPKGWKKGTKYAAVMVVMGLLFVGLNNGTMKGMNGQEISLFGNDGSALSQIEPAAGEVFVSGSSSSYKAGEEGAGSAPYDFGTPGVSEGYSGDDSGISYEENLMIAPVPVPQEESCGDHSEWVGKKVDERKIKRTGKPYRILKPNSMATQDYSAQRINVIINDKDIVIEVRCG